MMMAKLNKNQKDDMKSWNTEINKILDSNIDFTKLKYDHLKQLYEIFTTPGQLAIRIGKYKGPGILQKLL